MKRITLAAVVILVLVTGVLLLIGGPQQSLQSIRDARALAALPQVPVAPMLRMGDRAPDLVVFEDGAAGWFELDTSDLPRDLQIGMHGPRVIDILGGGSHVAVYCGGNGRDGKVLWAIRDGQIADDYAFCNPRRMDLGPLRPLAEPVEMVTQQLTRTEVIELTADIADNPTRAMVSAPLSMQHYTQRYILTPPLMWYIDGQTPLRHEVEQSIEATIIAHLGEAQMAFRRRPSSNPNLTFRSPDVTGMAIRHDGALAIVPDVWGEPYEIWIDCVPESCARLATLDLEGLFDDGRDLVGLRAAMRGLVEDPLEGSSPTPVEYFPTLEDFEASGSRIADPIEITYQLRYIQRP